MILVLALQKEAPVLDGCDKPEDRPKFRALSVSTQGPCP